MKNGKCSQSLIDLVVLILSVKAGSFMCDILERTAINVWIARGSGALVSVVVGLICLFLLKKKEEKADEQY